MTEDPNALDAPADRADRQRAIAAEHEAGLEHLRQQIAGFDRQAGAILACHAALENQLEATIAPLVGRIEPLSRLGFGAKVAVFQALYSEAWAQDVATALLALNNLRNTVAHNDAKQTAGCLRALRKSVAGFSGEGWPPTEAVEELAGQISLALTLLRLEPGAAARTG